MTREELIERVNKFQGANREFSQELPPIIEALCDEIDAAGPEVVDNLTSNSPTKALSANMGKELNATKQDAPTVEGTDGQILSMQSTGPAWIDAPEGTVVIDSAMSDSSTNTVQNKVIKGYVDTTTAKPDGDYPQLTAGRAKNIDGTSAIERTFLFDTTAGEADVATGPATVELVKGNSVAWNQLVQNGDFSDGTTNWIPRQTGGLAVVDGVAHFYRKDAANNSFAQKIDFIDGHKYYFCISISTINTSSVDFYLGGTANFGSPVVKIQSISNAGGKSFIFTANDNYSYFGASGKYSDVEIDGEIAACRWFEIHDLTLLNIDNLTTVAQVEAWLAAYVGSKPYYPASCKLLPAKLLGLKTRGFNQWDEEWEVGGISGTGINVDTYTDRGRSKNYIPVLPSTSYYFKTKPGLTQGDVFFYDTNEVFISALFNRGNNTFATPAGCAYIRFAATQSYGSTYNHDICINLSWDGSRDGEYEPYEEHDYNLDVTKFYGKLNGEGDYVQVFANGMRKAGSVCDLLDLKNAEADVKVGSRAHEEGDESDSSVLTDGTNTFYPLATPAHYTDLVYRDNGVDTPVEALNILVNNWSTEEEIIAAPEASGDPNSCSATLDIIYGIDAAEQLDTINQSGIFTGDLKANLSALLGVINTNCAEALGGTLSISENPTDKVYTFTFTPAGD